MRCLDNACEAHCFAVCGGLCTHVHTDRLLLLQCTHVHTDRLLLLHATLHEGQPVASPCCMQEDQGVQTLLYVTGIVPVSWFDDKSKVRAMVV